MTQIREKKIEKRINHEISFRKIQARHCKLDGDAHIEPIDVTQAIFITLMC